MKGVVEVEVILHRPTSRNIQLIGIEFRDHVDDWLKMYFSYQTIVAFHYRGHKMVVTQNVWSSTTGRHLNEIDGGRKEDRVDYNTFHEKLDEALERFFNK